MPHAHQDLPALFARASRRGGVVSSDDLRVCGFSAGAVRRRLAEGSWQRVGSAVLLAPRIDKDAVLADLSDLALAQVLSITYGSTSRISGPLALRRQGWRCGEDPTIHGTRIVVTPGKPPVGIPGTHVLRRLDAPAAPHGDGVRYVEAIEALMDSLVVLPRRGAMDLLDSVLQERRIVPSEFAAAAEGRTGHGRRGAAQLRALVRRALTGSRSEAEQRMRRLLKTSGTGPWCANHPLVDERGRVIAEIDFAHLQLRIAIEVDGRAHHSDRRAFERDRQRQNTLVIGGWLVLRFTWEQITQHPESVIAVVRNAVRQRSRELWSESVTG